MEDWERILLGNDVTTSQNIAQLQCCDQHIDDPLIHQGQRLCRNCGTVLEVVLDTRAEWRTTTGNTLVRCHTVKIGRWGNLSSRERMLQSSDRELDDIVQRCQLPKVVHRLAREYHRRVYSALDVHNYGVKRCNVRTGLLAACLFYACKRSQVPRETIEIAEMLGTDRKTVTKGCNELAEMLGDEFMHLPPFKPTDFAERYGLDVGLSFKDIRHATEIASWVEDTHIAHECTPTSVMAAIIVKALDTPLEKMCEHVKVSKTVVRKVIDKLMANPAFVQKITRH